MCMFSAPVVVSAQTATESAVETTASPEVTTQNLKERIERVVQEKKEEIRGAIDRMGTQKKGFIGEIQRISEETLTIRTNKGIRIVSLNNPDITILKNQSPITLENIAVGDWVVAMGFAEEDGTFTPRRLLISSDSLRPREHKVDIGTITEIGRTTLTFNSRQGGSPQELTLAKASELQDIQGETITLRDITTDMQALVVTYTDSSNNQVITVIRVLSDLSDSENG